VFKRGSNGTKLIRSYLVKVARVLSSRGFISCFFPWGKLFDLPLAWKKKKVRLGMHTAKGDHGRRKGFVVKEGVRKKEALRGVKE